MRHLERREALGEELPRGRERARQLVARGPQDLHHRLMVDRRHLQDPQPAPERAASELVRALQRGLASLEEVFLQRGGVPGHHLGRQLAHLGSPTQRATNTRASSVCLEYLERIPSAIACGRPVETMSSTGGRATPSVANTSVSPGWTGSRVA